MMSLSPSRSGTSHVMARSLTRAGRPLQVAARIPEPDSRTVADTGVVAASNSVSATGDVSANDGGVRSMLTMTVALASRPAASDTERVTCHSAPSALSGTASGHDGVRWQTNVTVTSELFQPEAFGGGTIRAVNHRLREGRGRQAH